MSTLNQLQRLSDGPFHRLGDDLLPRLEPRYRHLRTHGLNERGESIVGQPDSYVGETANSCTIAVCYTVQRKGWWNKVVEDVKGAIAASPSVEEVVAVIPHNADRHRPKGNKKGENINRLANARAASGSASFRLIHGPEIAQLLDTDHQDLRHQHLGIPYSRLSGPSILASARVSTATVIEAIRKGGRYDPGRYAVRSADRELYRLWQQCLRKDGNGAERIESARMIALVNDSGVGKTSLVCSFAASLVAVLPVVLVQARNLGFGSEDALVAHVIHALQGVLDPCVRVGEEVALTRHLAVTMPLTLIVDGLDETHAPEAVRKAITYWLRSRLGPASVLIVTSRSEFWSTCSDQYWGRWMARAISDERSPIPVAERSGIERNDSVAGHRLPDRFTEVELETSWVKAGRHRAELYALSGEAREELRHPFTLRVYLDLCIEAGTPPPVMARADLMEKWLDHRLDAEEIPAERITRDLFQQALQIVATRIAVENRGTISVDDLAGIPRFDPAHPPGPVVQRLIEASILESVPGHTDHIRFAVEAVQDFYRAETDIQDIEADPTSFAQRLAALRFTEVYPRLARIARRLARDEVRHRFVDRLAEIDPRMAAVVVAVASSQYTAELRAKVTQYLGRDISTRHRVRAALAITMLGELDCPEATNVLVQQLSPPADPHTYLKRVGATAFVKIGHPAVAEFVYRWGWFGVYEGNDTYYHREHLAMLRRVKPDFRQALAEHAAGDLDSPSGDPNHARAVYVLASLGDKRLVEHLKNRLSENGLFHNYENHALIALGTDAAAALFAQSVAAVGERLARIPNDAANNKVRHDLIWSIQFMRGIRYLITPAFEPHLMRLIDSDNPDVSWIASDFVKRCQIASLLYYIAAASARRNSWFDFPIYGERSVVTAELWLDWWRRTSDPSIQKKLLRFAPLCPSVEVEEALRACLDIGDLRGQAARLLGEYGSVRSAPTLRQILAEDVQDHSLWTKMEAAHALGDLRDNAAVPLLKAMISAHPKSDAAIYAAASLGVIGTPEAEKALCALFADGDCQDVIVSALIMCGTPSAMAVVVARAKTRLDGPEWLCEQASRLSWTRGWTRGRYYTHIHTTELVEYLDATYQPKSPIQNWDFVHAFRQIDSPDVRRLLRKRVEWCGTSADAVVREDDHLRMSHLCIRELIDRGDEFAIPYVLDQRADLKDNIYIAIAADDLRHFPSSAVAAEVCNRLSAATDTSQAVRMLSLLGRFGDASHEKLIRQFLDHPDDLVANVACESLLRLTDPLLVPEGWREL